MSKVTETQTHAHEYTPHAYVFTHVYIIFSTDYQESMARNQELSERKTVALLLDVSPSYPLCQPFMAL